MTIDSKPTQSLDDLAQTLRELSHSMYALAYLFSHQDQEETESADLEVVSGFGCILRRLGSETYQVSTQVDAYSILFPND